MSRNDVDHAQRLAELGLLTTKGRTWCSSAWRAARVARLFQICLGLGLYGACSGVQANPTQAQINGVMSALDILLHSPVTPIGGPSVQLKIQAQNTQTLKINPGTAGTYPLAYYKIYRNGTAYATTTSLDYTDSAAPNSTMQPGTDPSSYAAPATPYAYAVSAIDTQGNEGPQGTTFALIYGDGTFNWPGDYSYPGPADGGTAPNYSASENGMIQIYVPYSGTVNGAQTNGYYFQPYSGLPMSPEWAFEIGGFCLNTIGYMYFDYTPSATGQSIVVDIISRVPNPPGDVFNKAVIPISAYGPAPVAGVQGHYKIPLDILGIGTQAFTGSASGTTLSVTSVTGKIGIQPGGWLLPQNGIPPGTYLTTNAGTGIGGTGTYTLAYPAGATPPSVPAGTQMQVQRTNMYKVSFFDDGNRFYYINDFGVSSN